MTDLVKSYVIFKRSVDIFVFSQNINIKSCVVIIMIRKRLISDIISIEKIDYKCF